jgi:ParB family chromosome partitioning protein
VRPSGDGYRIIAGERRWRAAQRAGLFKVPVVVRDVAEDATQQHLELALIENIQRENLNPVEESLGYQRLVDEFGMTQEQIAAAVGKDRSTVANLLRLLRLPQEFGGGHTASHAWRCCLPSGRAAARRADISRAIGSRTGPGEALPRRELPRRPAPPTSHRPPKTGAFALGAKVSIVRRGTGGTIEIAFGSEGELNRIYEVITGKA